MVTPFSASVSAGHRPCIERGITVSNGKGGTGKTSLVANLAALYALAGYRVLAVDLDPQGDGNLGTDLGYNARGLTDRGQSLAMALSFGTPLEILRGVRENLDVVRGGRELQTAVTALLSLDRSVSRMKLLEVLAPYVSDYDLVLIDTPPGTPVLQEMAFATSRYALIPTRTDSASIDEGVGHIAQHFAAVKQQTNPDLTLLGAIIFGTTFHGEREKKVGDVAEVLPATARHQRVRERIEAILGSAAPVFRSYIRYVEAAADDARDGGQLAHELEREVLDGPAWYETLRNPGAHGQRLASSTSAGGLASDYQRIAEELIGHLQAAEQREVAHG